MDWLDPTKDMDSWRLDVNAVMKFWVHKTLGISLIAEDLVASEEGLCSMELSFYHCSMLIFYSSITDVI